MAYEVLVGSVSHFGRGSELIHRPVPGGGAATTNIQLLSFRLDGREVTYRTHAFPSVGDGDRVAVVGKAATGTFKVLALRNLTTQAETKPATAPLSVIGWPLLVLGALIVLVTLPPDSASIGFTIIGGIVMLVGGGFLFRAHRLKQAGKMLRTVTG